MFYAAKSGMKALPKILLALTAVAALSVAYPTKANLITNPGFETGNFTGWTTTGGGGSVAGTLGGIAPHSGNFQAAFGVGEFSISQNVTTTPGASYIVDFWLAGTGGALFSVSWGGGGIFNQAFSEGFGYTEHTFTVTALSPTTGLLFLSHSFGGNLLLDDVSVNPAGVGVPDGGSTVSLLGFASLGLVALRRKLLC